MAASNRCMNTSCRAAIPHDWTKGWPLGSAGYAHLCLNCGYFSSPLPILSFFHFSSPPRFDFPTAVSLNAYSSLAFVSFSFSTLPDIPILYIKFANIGLPSLNYPSPILFHFPIINHILLSNMDFIRVIQSFTIYQLVNWDIRYEYFQLSLYYVQFDRLDESLISKNGRPWTTLPHSLGKMGCSKGRIEKDYMYMHTHRF